jgi:PPOX class probable F420-dependent enzyme
MDRHDMDRLVASAYVARLATVGANETPHIVPICFALDDQTLYFAVDSKPKQTTNLKRLRNIAANSAVSILIDHYDDDWDKLWWIRLDGDARVVTDEGEVQKALRLLASRYSQYRAKRPAGPVVAVAITGTIGWSAT